MINSKSSCPKNVCYISLKEEVLDKIVVPMGGEQMSEDLTTPFLPLGSVLKLKDTTNDYIILFHCCSRRLPKMVTEKLFLVIKVAPHPFEDIPTQEVFFN